MPSLTDVIADEAALLLSRRKRTDSRELTRLRPKMQAESAFAFTAIITLDRPSAPAVRTGKRVISFYLILRASQRVR